VGEIRPLLPANPKRGRSGAEKVFIAGVALVAFLVVVLMAGRFVNTSEHTAPPATHATPAKKRSPAKPLAGPYTSYRDEAVLENAMNARLGVRTSTDAGTTCEQRNRRRTFYVCSTLKGLQATATGVVIRCSQSVTSSSAVGCTYTKMTPRQRCLFGVRSGIPGTPLPASPPWVVQGIEAWNEEAAICRELGVPIE
jgi:hypothetical protein